MMESVRHSRCSRILPEIVLSCDILLKGPSEATYSSCSCTHREVASHDMLVCLMVTVLFKDSAV